MSKDKYTEAEISAAFDAQADKLTAAGFTLLVDENFAYPHRTWTRTDSANNVVHRLYLTTYRRGPQKFACNICLHDPKRLCQKNTEEVHTGSLARFGKVVEQVLKEDLAPYLKQLNEDLAYKAAVFRAGEISQPMGRAAGVYVTPDRESSTIEFKVRVDISRPGGEEKAKAVDAALLKILGT